MKKRGDKMIERYRTIKENGQSEIEIKNHALSVLLDE